MPLLNRLLRPWRTRKDRDRVPVTVALNLYKRGKKGTYWIDEVIGTIRLRQSLHTTDWKVAQHTAKRLVSETTANQDAALKSDFADLPFNSAADEYVSARALELQPSTATKERQLLTCPRSYFGKKRLQHITLEDLIRYRTWRAESAVGNTIINMEVGLIRRMLKRARRWHLFEADIRPLREQPTERRALSPEEKTKLLEVAKSKPGWRWLHVQRPSH